MSLFGVLSNCSASISQFVVAVPREKKPRPNKPSFCFWIEQKTWYFEVHCKTWKPCRPGDDTRSWYSCRTHGGMAVSRPPWLPGSHGEALPSPQVEPRGAKGTWVSTWANSQLTWRSRGAEALQRGHEAPASILAASRAFCCPEITVWLGLLQPSPGTVLPAGLLSPASSSARRGLLPRSCLTPLSRLHFQRVGWGSGEGISNRLGDPYTNCKVCALQRVAVLGEQPMIRCCTPRLVLHGSTYTTSGPELIVQDHVKCPYIIGLWFFLLWG